MGGVHLLHVPVSERAQERSDRRRRPHARQYPGGGARAQQVQVSGAVRPGQHARNHLAYVRSHVRDRQRALLPDRGREARRLSEFQHGHEPRDGNQVRIV